MTTIDTLNPTDAQRIAAYAARYELNPKDCRVDGSAVFDGNGFGCWTLTLAEINAATSTNEDVVSAEPVHDPADRFTHGGTTWVIFPL